MPDSRLPEQLISALLDGQLTGEQRQRAEQLLAEDPALREKFQAWKANADRVANLPRYQLPSHFADQVLAVAESRKPAPGAAAKPTGASVASGQFFDGRTALGAILTLAAMLLLTLFVFPNIGKDFTASHLESTAAPGSERAPSSDADDEIALEPRAPSGSLEAPEGVSEELKDMVVEKKALSQPAAEARSAQTLVDPQPTALGQDAGDSIASSSLVRDKDQGLGEQKQLKSRLEFKQKSGPGNQAGDSDIANRGMTDNKNLDEQRAGKEIAGAEIAGNGIAGNRIAGNRIAGNEIAGNEKNRLSRQAPNEIPLRMENNFDPAEELDADSAQPIEELDELARKNPVLPANQPNRLNRVGDTGAESKSGALTSRANLDEVWVIDVAGDQNLDQLKNALADNGIQLGRQGQIAVGGFEALMVQSTPLQMRNAMQTIADQSELSISAIEVPSEWSHPDAGQTGVTDSPDQSDALTRDENPADASRESKAFSVQRSMMLPAQDRGQWRGGRFGGGGGAAGAMQENESRGSPADASDSPQAGQRQTADTRSRQQPGATTGLSVDDNIAALDRWFRLSESETAKQSLRNFVLMIRRAPETAESAFSKKASGDAERQPAPPAEADDK